MAMIDFFMRLLLEAVGISYAACYHRRNVRQNLTHTYKILSKEPPMDTLYRRWLILKMIPRHGNSITTAQIAERLAAEALEAKSVRTIQRDLEELSGSFPLVYEQEGRTFRWSWMDGAPRYDLPVMDPQTALTFCLVDAHLAALLPPSSRKHLEPYFSTARGILSGNPELPLAQWRDKVRIVSRSLSMEPPLVTPGVAETVYEALLKERQLTLRYRPRYEEKAKEYRDLNPLGLVFVDCLVYLAASRADDPQPRQFLLHRMEAAEMTTTAAIAPLGWSLQGYIESGEFTYPVAKETIRLQALFDRDVAGYLRETPLPGTISLTEANEDEVLLEAEVLDSVQLRWWLRGFGAGVEVLGPAGLREEFRTTAKALRKLYA
jgi:predicted DNA-binding transcriptional regulator YafY